MSQKICWRQKYKKKRGGIHIRPLLNPLNMKNLFSVFVPLYVANIRILTICSKFLELFWENSSFYSFTVLQFWKTFFLKMPQRKVNVIRYNVTGTGKRHHLQALQYNSFLNAHGWRGLSRILYLSLSTLQNSLATRLI